MKTYTAKKPINKLNWKSKKIQITQKKAEKGEQMLKNRVKTEN